MAARQATRDTEEIINKIAIKTTLPGPESPEAAVEKARRDGKRD